MCVGEKDVRFVSSSSTYARGATQIVPLFVRNAAAFPRGAIAVEVTRRPTCRTGRDCGLLNVVPTGSVKEPFQSPSLGLVGNVLTRIFLVSGKSAAEEIVSEPKP